ncbi:pirin family protein [Rhabdaerophilum sp. SD176]|uniref:pirin family protein n=1 Tax=Rhabdaerophilum sp. SD176 TaxID=2983548 RepID=UPI0024E0260F|nr:pirin family protein [Rhabdaerophilum sp. SD176]
MPPEVSLFKMPKGINRPELVTRDLMASSLGGRIDPFLVVSLFEMRGPLFPPHPHAGFSVATYIFPESEIGFWNQDALGNRNQIPPGALHLTVAGAGVMHEETVTRSGRSALGLQIWIDHAANDREVTPAALHLPAASVPTIASHGVLRRVLLGPSAGLISPINAPLSARIVDVELQDGAVLEERIPEGETAFAVIRAGEVETTAGTAGPASTFFTNSTVLRLTARGHARLTLFGGPPLRHSVVPAGPFVASSEAQARAFQARFMAGDMGRLTAFDQTELDRKFDQARITKGIGS